MNEERRNKKVVVYYEQESERQRRLEREAFAEIHDELSEKIKKAEEDEDWERVQYLREILRENY